MPKVKLTYEVAEDRCHPGDWRVEAKLCYDVTAGRQWDKDAEDAAKDASLTIVTLNKRQVRQQRVERQLDTVVLELHLIRRKGIRRIERLVGCKAVGPVVCRGLRQRSTSKHEMPLATRP